MSFLSVCSNLTMKNEVKTIYDCEQKEADHFLKLFFILFSKAVYNKDVFTLSLKGQYRSNLRFFHNR